MCASSPVSTVLSATSVPKDVPIIQITEPTESSQSTVTASDTALSVDGEALFQEETMQDIPSSARSSDLFPPPPEERFWAKKPTTPALATHVHDEEHIDKPTAPTAYGEQLPSGATAFIVYHTFVNFFVIIWQGVSRYFSEMKRESPDSEIYNEKMNQAIAGLVTILKMFITSCERIRQLVTKKEKALEAIIAEQKLRIIELERENEGLRLDAVVREQHIVALTDKQAEEIDKCADRCFAKGDRYYDKGKRLRARAKSIRDEGRAF